MKINIDDGIEITDEEENIYQKIARATARAVDINLGKATLADLLDGYTKSRILQQRIDRAIEYVRKLSSKGRDCEIYYDIKKEILSLLGDDENVK